MRQRRDERGAALTGFQLNACQDLTYPKYLLQRFGLGKCIMHLTSMIWNDYGRGIHETEHNSVPSRAQAHEAKVKKVLGPLDPRWLSRWATAWNTIGRHTRKYKVVLKYEYWAIIYLVQQILRASSSTRKAWRTTGIPKILTDISMDAVKQQHQVQKADGRTRQLQGCKRCEFIVLRMAVVTEAPGQGDELAVVSRQDKETREHEETATANIILDDDVAGLRDPGSELGRWGA